MANILRLGNVSKLNIAGCRCDGSVSSRIGVDLSDDNFANSECDFWADNLLVIDGSRSLGVFGLPSDKPSSFSFVVANVVWHSLVFAM